MKISVFDRIMRKWKKHKYTQIRQAYFISFPKSGRTWVRTFLSYYYFNLFPFYLLDKRSGKNNARIPKIIFTHKGDREKKGHEAVLSYYARIQSKKKVFLVRDPRDTFISYYFQLTNREQFARFNVTSYGNNHITIPELLRHDLYGIRRIISFLNWWMEILENDVNVIVLFYEDLQVNPSVIFNELLFFLGEEEINHAAFNLALQSSSFSAMKDREKQGVHAVSELAPGQKFDINSYKTRRGKIGGFVEYLSEDDMGFCENEMSQLTPKLGDRYRGN